MIAVRRIALLAMTLAGWGATPLRAQSPDLPIFDTHIHYSAPDWAEYPPDRILGILQKAGIKRALVSSTPDDGTLTLYQKDPRRVVPILRPYRTRDDIGHWWRTRRCWPTCRSASRRTRACTRASGSSTSSAARPA